jgi:hypothetical protein
MVLIHWNCCRTLNFGTSPDRKAFPIGRVLDRDELIEQLQENMRMKTTKPDRAGYGKPEAFPYIIDDFVLRQEERHASGLEELPKAYNETSVHLLLRDPNGRTLLVPLRGTRTEITPRWRTRIASQSFRCMIPEWGESFVRHLHRPCR